jgi:hypothetical protein
MKKRIKIFLMKKKKKDWNIEKEYFLGENWIEEKKRRKIY